MYGTERPCCSELWTHSLSFLIAPQRPLLTLIAHAPMAAGVGGWGHVLFYILTLWYWSCLDIVTFAAFVWVWDLKWWTPVLMPQSMEVSSCVWCTHGRYQGVPRDITITICTEAGTRWTGEIPSRSLWDSLRRWCVRLSPLGFWLYFIYWLTILLNPRAVHTHLVTRKSGAVDCSDLVSGINGTPRKSWPW